MTPNTHVLYNYTPVVGLPMRRYSDAELAYLICQPVQVDSRVLFGRLQGNRPAQHYFRKVKNRLGIFYSQGNSIANNNNNNNINNNSYGTMNNTINNSNNNKNGKSIVRISTLACYPAPTHAHTVYDIKEYEQEDIDSKLSELTITTTTTTTSVTDNGGINRNNNNRNTNKNVNIERGYYNNGNLDKRNKYPSNGAVTVNAYWDKGDIWTRSEDNDCYDVRNSAIMVENQPLFCIIEPFTYENINILSYFNEYVKDNPRNSFNKDKKSRKRNNNNNNKYKNYQKRFSNNLEITNTSSVSVASYNNTTHRSPTPIIAGGRGISSISGVSGSSGTLSPFSILSPAPTPTPPIIGGRIGIDCKSPELVLASTSSNSSSGRDLLNRMVSLSSNNSRHNNNNNSGSGGKFGAFKNYIFMAESFTTQLQTLVDPQTTLIDINRIYQFEIRYFQYCLLRGEVRFLQVSNKFLQFRNKDPSEKEYIIWRFCHCTRSRWNNEAIYGIGRRNKKISIDNENYQPWECVAIQKQSSIIKYFQLQFRSQKSQQEFLNLLPKPFKCEISQFNPNYQFESNGAKIQKLLTKGFEKYQAEERKKHSRMIDNNNNNNNINNNNNRNYHSYHCRYSRYTNFNNNNNNKSNNYRSHSPYTVGYGNSMTNMNSFNRYSNNNNNNNNNNNGDFSENDDSSSGNNTSSGDISVSSNTTDMSMNICCSNSRHNRHRRGSTRKSKKLSNEDKFRYLEYLANKEMKIEFNKLTKMIVDAIENAFKFAQENKNSVLTQAYMDEDKCQVNFENVILLEILDTNTNKTYKFGVPIELKGEKYIAKTILTPQMAIENVLLNTQNCGLPNSLNHNSWIVNMRNNKSFYQQIRSTRRTGVIMNNNNSYENNNIKNNNNNNNNNNMI